MPPFDLDNIPLTTLLHHSQSSLPPSFEHCSNKCHVPASASTEEHATYNVTPPPSQSPFSIQQARLLIDDFLLRPPHHGLPFIALALTSYSTANQALTFGLPNAAFIDMQLTCAYLIAHILSTTPTQTS